MSSSTADADPIPLDARTMMSLMPIYNIACADLMEEFTEIKYQKTDPATTLKVANKLKDCCDRATAKVESTPCADINAIYYECLGEGKISSCKAFRDMLEDCTAKHIGKLD